MTRSELPFPLLLSRKRYSARLLDLCMYARKRLSSRRLFERETRLFFLNPSMSSYSARFGTDGGLHPSLLINVTHSATNPPCDLYTSIDLPPTFIVDEYQLQRLNRAGRLARTDTDGGVSCDLMHVEGDVDLEAPAWRTGPSNVLLRLERTKTRRRRGHAAPAWEVFYIPLHLRYQTPPCSDASLESPGYLSLNVSTPTVFWACPRHCEPTWVTSDLLYLGADDTQIGTTANEAAEADVSGARCPPFPHSEHPTLADANLHCLPREGSSGSATAATAVMMMSAPVGDVADLPLVETVTTVMMWLCFLWVTSIALRPGRRPRSSLQKQ